MSVVFRIRFDAHVIKAENQVNASARHFKIYNLVKHFGREAIMSKWIRNSKRETETE